MNSLAVHFNHMGDHIMKLLRLLVIPLAALVAVPALGQDKPANTMEIVREKVKADKKLLVAENMQLTDSEAKGFWPIYEAYQGDLQKINERMGNAIVEYAEAYNKGPLPDEKAKKLLDEALTIEEAETKLKRSYVPKLEKALPPAKVARYIQIENKIRAVVRYELANGIPLAQ
jgi:hypothetical protein